MSKLEQQKKKTEASTSKKKKKVLLMLHSLNCHRILAFLVFAEVLKLTSFTMGMFFCWQQKSERALSSDPSLDERTSRLELFSSCLNQKMFSFLSVHNLSYVSTSSSVPCCFAKLFVISLIWALLIGTILPFQLLCWLVIFSWSMCTLYQNLVTGSTDLSILLSG